MLVAMSHTTGGRSRAGNAIAIGLLPSTGATPPVGAIDATTLDIAMPTMPRSAAISAK